MLYVRNIHFDLDNWCIVPGSGDLQVSKLKQPITYADAALFSVERADEVYEIKEEEKNKDARKRR